MYLSRFGVKNYKCLGEIDIPLTPIHVLIGENDAGKTSLLEAMAAFCASCDSELADVFPKPWQGCELVFHGSSEPHVELWGEWTAREEEPATAQEGCRYGFWVDFPPQGTTCTTLGDWMERNGERRNFLPESRRGHTALKRFNVGKEVPHGDRADLETVSSLVRRAHKYALDPTLMATPAAFGPERRFRLDPDGFGLATLLDDILGYDLDLFIQIRKQFCEFFPQFKNVYLQTEQALQRQYSPAGMHGTGTAVGKAIHFLTRADEKIRAQHASDGAILFLGFLALAHLPDPPNLLLIEEPENGIYPKRLGEVIQFLQELVSRTEGVRFPQIIISTHSPYLLSFFKPEQVTFLSRPPDQPDGPVRARPLRDAPNIRERLTDGFYLGELWYNLSEEDLFGEP